MSVGRGILLYGDSGVGKSSLVNAGLLPVIEDEIPSERLRLQFRRNEEILLERVEGAEASRLTGPLLVPPEGDAAEMVFSIAEFGQQVRVVCEHRELLLIFDHFEDVVVLFDGVDGEETRGRLIEMLVDLLCEESLKVKLLFVFRDDYFGWVSELLAACPDRFLCSLRLHTPKAAALEQIIRGPFERYPGRYEPEVGSSLARRLLALLGERFGAGDVSLSEVQTVCLRLWQSEHPEMLLETRGLQGILEDYLNEELDEFTPEMKEAAIGLLSEMVTPAGTRDIISGEDLASRMSVQNGMSPMLVRRTLEQLDQSSRLVHCERRRDVRLYEITSEFLVPWISEQREQLERQRERRREQSRRRLLGRITAAALLLAGVLAGLTAWALAQRSTARHAAVVSHREAVTAASLALLSVSQEELEGRRDVSLLLGLAAYEMDPTGEARSALVSELEDTRSDGMNGILHGATTPITSVDFSPNGRVVAAGASDGVVRLWSVTSRKQLGEVVAGNKSVKTVVFAPRGQSFATGDEDGTIRLWNASTYQQLGRSIETKDPVVDGIAFSPDGEMLAAGGLGGPLSIWSVATHEELGPPIATGVGSVAFSPDGRILATGDYDRTVRLWSVRSRRQLGVPLETFTNQVTELAFSPDGRTLATLTTELFIAGRIQLWSVASHRQLGGAIGGSKEISGFAFSPDKPTLAAGGNGGTTLWSLTSDREVGQPLQGVEHVAAVAFSPDGRTIASAEGDLVELASAAGIKPLESLGGHLSGGSGTKILAFGDNGRTLVSASENGQVRHWNPVTHVQLDNTLHTLPTVARCRTLSADADTLASQDGAGTIWLWDLVSGRLLARLSSGPPPPEEPNKDEASDCAQRLALSPSGQTLAVIAGEAGGEVQFWNLANRSLIGELEASGESFRRIAFSPDGGTLVSVSVKPDSEERGSRIQLWNEQSRRRLGRGFAVAGDIGHIAIGPGGRSGAMVRITSESAEVGKVLVWDGGDHKRLDLLPLKQGESVGDIALSPDGRTLASLSGEGGGSEETGGQVRLWDLATGKSMGGPINEGVETAQSLVFSQVGTALAFPDEEGTIRLWRGILWSNLDELRNKVCGLVGEGLTRSEWAAYVPGIPYRYVC